MRKLFKSNNQVRDEFIPQAHILGTIIGLYHINRTHGVAWSCRRRLLKRKDNATGTLSAIGRVQGPLDIEKAICLR